ncbi:MAG: NAD kinase [Alphaproteobacteria bacterium]|nr:NAD kinase [Alphaproteobacteria bacterium]
MSLLRPISKIAFTASLTDEARRARDRLAKRYGDAPSHEADAIVALGGDGFILQTVHDHLRDGCPIFGMNLGSVGFLMNDYAEEDLPERLATAEAAVIHPLKMVAVTQEGETAAAIAVNEVSLLRETRQAAKIRILVDGKIRLEELICDGVLVSTPAGSTAYNLSAHGPILPIDSMLLALTSISAFRPRRWRGALLPHSAQVRFEILEAVKRPVSAVADHTEIRNVTAVDVAEDRNISITLLFDAGRNLNERILNEQFLP